ncbi:MAG: FHA domain-containing protein [Lachnospiraceae bacterium]|nr:FHA domain-containing protein [Lachnospiraceae bacterium]
MENCEIEIMNCDNNPAYVLGDATHFSLTEYKVLQSFNGEGLAKCFRMSYNGKLELFYSVGGTFRPLSHILPLSAEKDFAEIIKNLLIAVLEVKNNGFLNLANLDVSLEHIYVDRETRRVKFVYIPINRNSLIDARIVEDSFLSEMIELICNSSLRLSDEIYMYADNNEIGTFTVQDLYTNLAKNNPNSVFDESGFQGNGIEEAGRRLLLTSMNSPVIVEFDILKDKYAIGKSENNDGVIGHDNLISRKHCLFERTVNGFTVKDLNSTNGTFINGKRLTPDASVEIKNDDSLRIADIVFKVEVR